MTRNEFLEFLRTDPVFKVADKQVIATLYESPFDNAVLDEDTGSLALTLNGESFTFESDDTALGDIMSDNPCLAIIIMAKRVILSAGFRESDSQFHVVANDTDITTNAVIEFPAPADEGGDDGGNS